MKTFNAKDAKGFAKGRKVKIFLRVPLRKPLRPLR